MNFIEDKTNDQVIIYTPAKGDRCFDAPLLCTPNFNEKLKVGFDKNNNPKIEGIRGIKGRRQQYANTAKMVILRLPFRIMSQPVKGMANKAPIEDASKVKPKKLLSI